MSLDKCTICVSLFLLTLLVLFRPSDILPLSRPRIQERSSELGGEESSFFSSLPTLLLEDREYTVCFPVAVLTVLELIYSKYIDSY